MSQTLRQITVVSQKKKALGLGVEPANVEESWQMGREQIENRVPRIGVAACGNKTRRFMQDDVEPALAVNEFAVDFDVVALAGLRAEIGADLAVNRNAPGRDQSIAMPPRTKPGRGKETIQAHEEIISDQVCSPAEHWSLATDHFLHVRLGFRQAEDFLALLELAALLQQFDALETFQNVPLRGDGAGSF